METTTFIALASIAISVIFAIKWWVTCNKISDINERLKAQESAVDKNYLLYLYHSNDPSFERVLSRTIYNDLYAQLSRSYADDMYKHTYKKWMQTCETYHWLYPELLMGIDTIDKFKERFLIK